ncbi:MAG TPA: SRPBCC domain-containing protein [Chitinophagaceae bacterium]|nr:SRPBCC domain-containing protein [Chitinophagaceae bacterium]
MQKINFSTSINAPKEKVWNVLWDDASYRKWTSAFTEGSYAVTDNWKEGSEVKFLDPKGSGMISKVAANRPNEYMSFEHLGEIRDGVEDRDSEKIKEWAGAKENYTLKEVNGKTELKIDMDISEEYKDMFTDMWPKALEKVKELSEQ